MTDECVDLMRRRAQLRRELEEIDQRLCELGGGHAWQDWSDWIGVGRQCTKCGRVVIEKLSEASDPGT